MKTDSAVAPHTVGFFRRHWRKFFVLAAIAVLVAVSPFLFISGYIAYSHVSEVSQRIPFDSASWKSSLGKDDNNHLRLRMVDDLLKRHSLLGMTRARIADLLGEPPSTNYFSDYQFVYWLGPERGFMSIDSEWLAIRFDSQDRVTHADVVRD
jgi:SmpA / OmlA family